MKATIISILVISLLLLSVVSATPRDFAEYKKAYTLTQGSLLDKILVMIGTQSVQGDLYCCEGCQVDTQSGGEGTIPYNFISYHTINCNNGGVRAYIDLYAINDDGSKTPKEEIEASSGTASAQCIWSTNGCYYECYTCNKEADGGEPGLQGCSSDLECQNRAKSMGLTSWGNYICDANSCRQNCDANWGNWYCADSNTRQRDGTRVSGCSDPAPKQAIDCLDGQSCKDGVCGTGGVPPGGVYYCYIKKTDPACAQQATTKTGMSCFATEQECKDNLDGGSTGGGAGSFYCYESANDASCIASSTERAGSHCFDTEATCSLALENAPPETEDGTDGGNGDDETDEEETTDETTTEEGTTTTTTGTGKTPSNNTLWIILGILALMLVFKKKKISTKIIKVPSISKTTIIKKR